MSPPPFARSRSNKPTMALGPWVCARSHACSLGSRFHAGLPREEDPLQLSRWDAGCRQRLREAACFGWWAGYKEVRDITCAHRANRPTSNCIGVGTF
jgi:hypothetical protein